MIKLHVLGVTGHEHAHEIPRIPVGVGAGDQDFVDVLVVEIADRAFDQRAFLVDQRRRRGFQREIADRLPQPQQIFEVALDLGLGAAGAGRAQDHAHAFRHFQLLSHLLEPLAVDRIGDLAADAAAARRIGHQHGVAAGQRQIGRERGAFGAAFFLDDLHQHHLAALDHFLDLVLPPHARHALGHFLHRIGAAHRFDRFVLAARAVDLGDIVFARAVIGRCDARRFTGRIARGRLGAVFLATLAVSRNGFGRGARCDEVELDRSLGGSASMLATYRLLVGSRGPRRLLLPAVRRGDELLLA